MVLVDGSNVTIAHLGVISGMINTLGICDYIDQVLLFSPH